MVAAFRSGGRVGRRKVLGGRGKGGCVNELVVGRREAGGVGIGGMVVGAWRFRGGLLAKRLWQ